MQDIQFLFRKKRALGSFSIENSFAEVQRAWGDGSKPKWVEASHYSEGLTKRLNIIRETRKIKTDILHITGDIHFAALAWPKWRKGRPQVVLTIHDIGFLAELSGLKHWLIRKFWIQWPLRCVDHLVVVSTATKEAVLKEVSWFPITKTSVIPSVIPQHFKPRQGRPANKKAVALHIGLAENKNLKGHAEALTGFNVHLRIIGEPSKADRSLLQGLNIDFSWASRLSDEEMQAEYANADIILFASKLEGFGMPIIEAQTVGVPVITSDVDPMREVAGTGALLCNPDDNQSIKTCIKRLLADEDIQASLIAAGYENAKRYSPAQAARQYQELYKQLTHAQP